ncbi:class I SAM-dependent methyltransferase [Thermoproteota archaeon]
MNKEKLQIKQKMHNRGKQRAEEAIICLTLSGHDAKSGLLLDFGCGPGHLHEYFLKSGIESIGVELSQKTIQAAKKNVPIGSFVLADGRYLPFKKECFNTVISNDVLEHIPYIHANLVLTEVNRTLNANARFYISVANRYQIHEPHTLIPFLTWFPRPCWNQIHKLLRKRPLKETYFPYTTRMLERLCRETKFSYNNFTWIYALKKTSKIGYIGNRTVRKIAQILNKIGFSRPAQIIAERVSVIIFVCRKY